MSLKIDVSDIIEHSGVEKRFEGQTNFETAAMGERRVEFPKAVDVRGELRNVGYGILAVGEINAVVGLECSRCLDKFEQRLTSKLEELFVSSPEQRIEEEKEVFPIINDEIDLEPAVYQQIMTDVPFKPLCQLNCAGICPICGRNKNRYPHVCQEEALEQS